MDRTLEEATETVRRIIGTWVEGNTNAALSTKVKNLPTKRQREHSIALEFLPHLFLVAVEAESADPIGNDLTIESTLGVVIRWLSEKPLPPDEDMLEWSEDAPEDLEMEP
jgi:hypothetical protein